MQTDYLLTLQSVFNENADPERAVKMEAYLKDQFKMFGINAPLRLKLIQPFLSKTDLPSKEEGLKLVKTLWQKPEREYHYFAMVLAHKYAKKWDRLDLSLIEYMIIHQSWWDTVDFIADKLLGSYFKQFPDEIETVCNSWLNSGNMWLQRSCLLFQLKYKKNLDTELLERIIERLKGSKEFFINKAIGWILREHSKTDAAWVRNYLSNNALHPLSKREASKYI